MLDIIKAMTIRDLLLHRGIPCPAWIDQVAIVDQALLMTGRHGAFLLPVGHLLPALAFLK